MENEQRDEQLWKQAHKRANFKKSLTSYLIINAFLWAIWYFTTGRHTDRVGFPWPLWVMLGWGIGLAFQYFAAYGPNRENQIDKEYEKLMREKENRN
ncbi:MAG TPA: 2TM domain-containing protein [Flavitalea sp.]|nr:2TM domain-containing protein [Flavitalea sp.]